MKQAAIQGARFVRAVVCVAALSASCSDDEGDASPDTGLPDLGSDASDTADAPDDDATDGSDQEAIDEAAREALQALPVGETINIPGLQAPVEVLYTELGVPHLYAESEADAYRVMGWLHARDRMFVIELGRRFARGTLSELLGSAILSVDLQARGQGMRDVADSWERLITPAQRALYEAYAVGVNAALDEMRAGTLPTPSEFQVLAPLLGFARPADLLEEFEARDVAAFSTFILFQLGYETSDLARAAVDETVDDHFADFDLAALRQAGLRADLWDDHSPVIPVASAPGFGVNASGGVASPAGRAAANASGRAARTPQMRLPDALQTRVQNRHARTRHLFRRGDQGDHGSNVWAVAGSHTADGATLVAGDGHLQMGVPPLFYQMGLDTRLFGGGDLTVLGLFFAGFPTMGVGTNGSIAWSQTYLYGDITDWYREQIRLGEDGLPAESFFDGTWRPLVRVDETYRVAGTLGEAEREETWPVWRTFDGRILTDVEGRLLDAPSDAASGEAVMSAQGDWVVPGDLDGDGIIVGISFDYTGFDDTGVFQSQDALSRAQTVDAFRDATRKHLAYAGNFIVGDRQGDILYTSYNATPCREYLPRGADGRWVEGADPTRLLDGTKYGGFSIPRTATLEADEAAGQGDPYRCVIPFDAWPVARSPESGYLLNANNDPVGQSFDGILSNDLWYLGGFWAPGYRADTIRQVLQEEATARTASVASMMALQGDHRSRMGQQYAPILLALLARAPDLAPTSPVGTWYAQDREGIQAAAIRLEAWLEQGAIAESGVDTFYDTPDDAAREAAVATMIFNAWLRQFVSLVLDDEGLDAMIATDPRGLTAAALHRFVMGRGVDNPMGLASWNPDTAESVYFDIQGTPEVETSDELMVRALVEALAQLRERSTTRGVGGFGTNDMSQWLWGLRHQARFPSILVPFAGGNPLVDIVVRDVAYDTRRLPLAADIPRDDPRTGLRWFPRPGDLFAVDAANPPFNRRDYWYDAGPMMRMVFALDADGVRGHNVLPGGQSGVLGQDHDVDQLRLWLGNEALPMWFAPIDVVRNTQRRDRFVAP